VKSVAKIPSSLSLSLSLPAYRAIAPTSQLLSFNGKETFAVWHPEDYSMKRAIMTCVVAAALAFGGFAVAADAPAVAATPVPPAVTLTPAAGAAVAKAFPKATLGKVSTYERGNVKNSIVAMTEGDKKFDVRVTDEGLIVSIATPMKVADLPKVIVDAVASTDNNPEGATTDSASKIEWRADRRGEQPLEKPTFSYAVRLVKGDQAGILMVADDGTVRRPVRLTPIPKPAEAPTPAPTK
jgi:hypothetical protein